MVQRGTTSSKAMARSVILNALAVGLVLRVAIMPLLSWAQSNSQRGWSSQSHIAVLGVDSDRVYLALSRPYVSLDEALREPWEVHSAPRTGGAMRKEQVRPRNVKAWEMLQHIQHVAMHPSGRKALISARRNGGDFDVFLSYRVPSRVPGGRESWSAPMPLDGINSEAEDVFPQWQGQDISFASNRSGKFQLFTSKAVRQFLRAEPFTLSPALQGELLGLVTVGPSFTWVARRLSEESSFEVIRVSWPEPERPLPSGWTLCINHDVEGQVLTIREVNTRAIVQTMTLDDQGCVSLEGLPSGNAWTIQWEGTHASASALAEIRSPEGLVVRRYELNFENGFAFVLLPLDLVDEMAGREVLDDSNWPASTLAVVQFDVGSTRPIESSWNEFVAWSSELSRPNSGRWIITGHTDESGGSEVNLKLSLERASFVSNHLMQEKGWSREGMEVSGLGSKEPLGTDAAQNRRVEVRWVRSLQ